MKYEKGSWNLFNKLSISLNWGSVNQGSLNQSFYRYSAKERAGSDKDELKDCNTLAGAKVFGLQAEESNFNCENEKLMDNTMESQSVDRMVITTFGSFLADSLQKWSKQVISLEILSTRNVCMTRFKNE